MSGKVEACAECTKRCIQLHRKTKDLSYVTSFFKVMFGDLFSQILYLPPKFAATVSTLVNKEVVLEDSLGQQWEVTVSDCEGALAFEEGWSAFSSEHSLEIGDFVIFNHVMNLHFIVRIYTKTGCEKVDFAKKSNLRKRTSIAFDKGLTNPQASSTSMGSGSNVAVSQEKCYMTDSQNMNAVREKRLNFQSNDEWHRPHFKTGNFDDSYGFINRNKDDRLEENRSPLFDLFSMEMQKNNPSSNENETNKVTGDKVHPNLATTSPSTISDACQVEKPQVVKGENVEIFPSHVTHNETIEKSHWFEEVDVKITVSDKDACHDKAMGVPFVTSAMNSVKVMEHFCDTSFKVAKECQNVLEICNMPSTIARHDQAEAVSRETHTFPTDYCPSAKHEYTPNSFGVQKCLPGEVTKIIKQEPLEMTPEVDSHGDLIKEIWEPKVIMEEFIERSNGICGDHYDVHRVFNTDNADPVGISSPSAEYISCLVVKDTPSFLELPTCLPSSNLRGRRNPEKKKVVYLRDPGRRLWPILYHEMPEIQVLTSGWEAFSSANQIQPGDECLFRVEDEFERIYEVSIRKCEN